jgi:APA family basic amino acid/polyamine antiporter
VVPLVFIVAGLGIVANTFVADPVNAIIGSVILAVGVPVFFLWRRFAPAAA